MMNDVNPALAGNFGPAIEEHETNPRRGHVAGDHQGEILFGHDAILARGQHDIVPANADEVFPGLRGG